MAALSLSEDTSDQVTSRGTICTLSLTQLRRRSTTEWYYTPSLKHIGITDTGLPHVLLQAHHGTPTTFLNIQTDLDICIIQDPLSSYMRAISICLLPLNLAVRLT